MVVKIYKNQSGIVFERDVENIVTYSDSATWFIQHLVGSTYFSIYSIAQSTFLRQEPYVILRPTIFSEIQDENGVPFSSPVDALNFLISIIGTDSTSTVGFNYIATDYDDLLTIATNPAESELAYVQESQGTRWLPGSFGGSYRPKGTYVYSGGAWVSDKNNVAQQLQINTDKILAIELVNGAQEAAIIANTSDINQNALQIAANQNAISFNALVGSDNANAILQETIARGEDVNLIVQQLGNEIDSRIDGDQQLQNNIDSESLARQQGDQGSVTVHNDISNAGSGQIITNQERSDINESVGVHDDVELNGFVQVSNDKLKWNGNEFIPTLNRIYVNPNLLINNTNVLSDVINVLVNIQRLVVHKITVSYGWSLNDGAQDFVSVASLGGINLVSGLTDNSEIHRQEPKDVGSADPDGRGTNQRHRFSGVFYVTPTSLGNNQLLLQHSGSQNGDLASIWNAIIEIDEFVQIN